MKPSFVFTCITTTVGVFIGMITLRWMGVPDSMILNSACISFPVALGYNLYVKHKKTKEEQ